MPVIKNYGFLWERKYIFRGTGGDGNSGHLRGWASSRPTADFRDQIGVYVLYDRNQTIEANGVASWKQMGSRLVEANVRANGVASCEQMRSRLVLTHSRKEVGPVAAAAPHPGCGFE